MGGGEDHVAGKAHLPRDVRLQPAQFYRRPLGRGGEEPLRQAQDGDDLHVPGPLFGVQQAGGAGVGVLVGLDAGEVKAQVLGQHEEIRRMLQPAVGLVPAELVDGVEGLELDARLCIESVKGNDLVGNFRPLGAPAVPVAVQGRDGLVCSVQQHIIHRPGVDAHAVRGDALLPAGPEAADHLPAQPVQVPDQAAVLLLRQVGKAVDLLHFQLAVLPPGGDVPPGGRADVNG